MVASGESRAHKIDHWKFFLSSHHYRNFEIRLFEIIEKLPNYYIMNFKILENFKIIEKFQNYRKISKLFEKIQIIEKFQNYWKFSKSLKNFKIVEKLQNYLITKKLKSMKIFKSLKNFKIKKTHEFSANFGDIGELLFSNDF